MNDTVQGGAGNDRLERKDGDDTLIGGAGDDRIRGGNGDDFIDASEGVTTYVVIMAMTQLYLVQKLTLMADVVMTR